MTKTDAELNGGVGLAQPRELRGVFRFSHEAMATVFEVFVAHDNREYAAQAAHAAFELVDRLERELSRFLPNSDITRVNHLEAGASTRVAPSTLECLLIARHLFTVTGGAFDISIGTGLPALELDADESTVRASHRGVRLDLGGIGKGYAVDLMSELLEDHWGVSAALVHGGFSSVVALEPPAGGDGWPLTLSDPATPSTVLERVPARQVALSASGVRKHDHIVDPTTGQPVRARRAAWVALPRPRPAPTDSEGGPRDRPAAVADALTTACMLLDQTHIDALCRHHPGLEAWILEEDGLVYFGERTRETHHG